MYNRFTMKSLNAKNQHASVSLAGSGIRYIRVSSIPAVPVENKKPIPHESLDE